MSDPIKHECGIALVRLLKPLQYYEQKYGSPLYGFNKLFLLMEKQHNRGQDGAGIGSVKLNVPAGQPYMFRERSIDSNSLAKVFGRQMRIYQQRIKSGEIVPEFAQTVKDHFDFGAEIVMGHLRYGTSGAYSKSSCHPYFRKSNWPTKNLMVMGNFNMTNTEELNRQLMQRGQHPIFDTDTQTILEEIGYHLDEQHDDRYRELRDQGVPGDQIPQIISDRLDIPAILREAAKVWDGGYTIVGMVGNGDCFIFRDPHGIRPAHVFMNEEVIAFASERVPLLTGFDDSRIEDVKEVPPGHVLVVKNDGTVHSERFAEETARTSCSFERIYFSRGNDPDIYRERKALGAALAPRVVASIGGDVQHAVFGYVPNTAETAYYGLLDALRVHRRHEVRNAVWEAHEKGELTPDLLDELILGGWPRAEKIAIKDIKLRTFIAQEKGRNQLVSHVYDISYGVVKPEDALVVVDDSIVRGTTLKRSILKILSRTNPRKIVIASTAPQIRYPDCYGIDMSELGKFIAFQAAVSLLKERKMDDLLREVYERCLEEQAKPGPDAVNHVRAVYEPFTAEEISARIAKLVYPKDIPWRGEVEILYQSIEDLHEALEEHSGDWYFTGNYPTPGGTGVANRAFIHYYEDRKGRTYDVPGASALQVEASAEV